MKAGDRLADRWRLDQPLPTTDGVLRWAATDEATGDRVEVLELGAGRSSPDDRKAFRDVHLALRHHEHAVATLDVGYTEQQAWAARPRLGEATLRDVGGPLDAAMVAAIGASLVPAVVASGATARGSLLPGDVALDPEGRPVLAPRGAPLNQVVRGTTRAVAPEVIVGASADGASALYGLGVLLYRLATGRDPQIGSAGAPPAPPSAARHGIPGALDDAILLLLSPDPGARIGALPLLQQVAGGESAPDLRPHVRARAVVGEVDLSVDRPARHRRHDPTPRAMVIVPHRALARLEPDGRSAAAGLAGVSLDMVDEAIAEGLPLAVAGYPLRVEAARDARRWREETGVPLEAGVAGAGRGLWLPLVAALVVGIPLALLTGILALVGVTWLAVPAAAALAVDGTFALVMWLAMRRAAADWGTSSEAWRLVAVHRDARRESGLQPVSADLAALRRQIAQADLPPAAASDLRSVLKEVDVRIGALQERADASAAALRQVDATDLRTRLGLLLGQGELDAAQAAERDRLTRIIADLDDVSARQRSVYEEAARLRDALAEVAAVLGRLGEDDPDRALADLGAGARRVEEAARDGGDDDEAQRRRERLVARARAERTTQ